MKTQIGGRSRQASVAWLYVPTTKRSNGVDWYQQWEIFSQKWRIYIVPESLYPICALEAETVGRIIWNCPSCKDVTSHPNDTQYCPLLAPLNQTSQEVTHHGTTPAEARLTAEF
jgi:hypothetical protein